VYIKAKIAWRNRLPSIILLAAKKIVYCGIQLLFPEGSKRTYDEEKTIVQICIGK
jgi:hypothetical protein